MSTRTEEYCNALKNIRAVCADYKFDISDKDEALDKIDCITEEVLRDKNTYSN